MKTYTAICQYDYDIGTLHFYTFTAKAADCAPGIAIDLCATELGCEADEVGVKALFEGNAQNILPYISGVAPKPDTPAQTFVYTTFCRSEDGEGTTNIANITLNTPIPERGENRLDEACALAEAECALDWGCDPCKVRCIGIAEGDVTITFWND